MYALYTLWVALRSFFAGEVLRRRVIDELASLSDRDLSDMGVSRSEIRRLAREAAEEAMRPAAQPAARPATLAGSVRTA
ncbi:DUF1127 domain-containing protein [Xanthobacter versatilis]|uniref:DUF1127 domain-containing protein n=1 Tax=Xanthobacter autotrophicus (strain ATCC BAA-1158 / Py2) TaxID=78245 RepID=UPI003729993D